MASETSDRCLICNAPATTMCGRCRAVHYCSRDCQRSDWSIHKILCQKFSIFDKSSRPSDNHYLAILFQVEEEEPELVWLHNAEQGDERRWRELDLASFIGSDTTRSVYAIEWNSHLQQELTNELILCYRSAFRLDGSKPNKCLSRMKVDLSGGRSGWRGPVLAYSRVGPDAGPLGVYRDIDMADFRHIIDTAMSITWSSNQNE